MKRIMRAPYFYKFILVLLFMPYPLSSFSQEALITALDSTVFPLSTSNPSHDFNDHNPLLAALRDKKVIALGEATHGTKEFFDYKHQLLRYLVSELKFKTFVIEADFAGTAAMNDYIQYGKGDLYNGLQKMTLGVWFTQEFVDMVEWMRQYNQDKDVEDKIKFYGCDIQFAFNSGAALKSGIIKLDRSLSAYAMKGLDYITEWAYVKVGKENQVYLDSLSKELSVVRVIEEDQRKRALYEHEIRTILQTIEYAKAPYMFDRDIIRDKCMAENAAWIYNYEAKNKMIVWAHNIHVAKSPTKDKNPPMGFYLKKIFQENLFVIGFGFNSGKLSVWNRQQKRAVTYTIPDVQIKKSSDYVFKQVQWPNFFLDFNRASVNPILANFLDEKLNARAIGGYYDESKQATGENGTFQKLNKMYDAIIFFRDTNASRPYNRDR